MATAPPVKAANTNIPPAGAKKPRKKKSGSETRQSIKIVRTRYTPEQHERLKAFAEAAALSVSAYIRFKTIEDITGPQKPTPALKLTGRYLAELGKIGSNLNQIARRVNLGSAGVEDIEATLEEGAALRNILMKMIEAHG